MHAYDFFPDTPFMRTAHTGRSQPSAQHQAQLAALRSRDPSQLLQALSDLHQQLVLTQDEAFASFPVEAYLTELVMILSESTDPETGVLAVKSIGQVLDALPSAAHLVAVCGGVSALCGKLVNLEYIDIAEAAIKCLDKLAREQAAEILREGALQPLLGLVELLDSSTQKQAFAVACSIARTVNSSEAFKQWVTPALPSLSSCLLFHGQEQLSLNEMAVDCYLSLLLSLERMDPAQSNACLEMMNSSELLGLLLRLGKASSKLVSGVLRLLRALCKLSLECLRQLLALDALKFVAGCLDEEEPVLQDALSLTAALLPTDPESQDIYQSRPEYLRELGAAVLPKVLRAYDSAASRALRRVCLDIVDRLLARSSPQLVRSFMTPREVARFLRELLESKEVSAVKTALKLTCEMAEKLPEEMGVWLAREGVVAKAAQLSREDTLTELFEGERRTSRGRGYRPGLEAHSMEQLISQIRQRAQRSRSVMQEPVRGRDQESKADFQRLLSRVAARAPGPEAGAAMARLLTLTERLAAGEEGELPHQLLTAIGAEDTTAHELCQSQVLEALWTWLAGGMADPSVPSDEELASSQKHLFAFLNCLLKEGSDGELQMATLVRKLVSALRLSHHFPIVLHEAGQFGGPGIRVLSQRGLISLAFDPQLSICLDPSEQAEKTELFAHLPGLTLTLELFQTFDSVRDALSKIKNSDDLHRFAMNFQRSFAEIRARYSRPQRSFSEDLLRQFHESADPTEMLERLRRIEEMEEDSDPQEEEEDPEIVRPVERKDSSLGVALMAKLFLNGLEIPKGATLFEMSSRANIDFTEGASIRFAFFPREVELPQASHYLRDSKALLRSLLTESLEIGLPAETGAAAPLRLLKLLNSCNRHMLSVMSPGSLLFPLCRSVAIHAVVPPQTFYCPKLTALLTRQLQDVAAMAGGVAADWVKELPRESAFLFPFPLRSQLLRSWALGPLKSLTYFAQKLKNTPEGFQVRVQRQKVCVARDQLLDSAMRVMRDRSLLQSGVLEFDFLSEQGTGKGPTLEFYALVSKAVRQLPIWRDTGEQCGVFPRPGVQAGELFEFTGRFVAKALLDDRLLDLPLSPVFWKLVFRLPLVLTDVAGVDRQLGETLLELQAVLNRANSKEQDVSLHGVSVEALGLTFVLPGYELELKPGGSSITVTLESLAEYLGLVASATLLQTQASEAFRRGLETLVPVERLRMFAAEELESLLCGEQEEDWTYETLSAAVVAAHGYTKNSPVFEQVLRAVAALNSDQRKLFLQFVTGTPRLPLGGFAGLSPPLTVVKKDPDLPGASPDAYLPSVMTCQNYLKMPAYSSFAVLQQQLLYACTEGHESFHLT